MYFSASVFSFGLLKNLLRRECKVREKRIDERAIASPKPTPTLPTSYAKNIVFMRIGCLMRQYLETLSLEISLGMAIAVS
jgi:hypothetical protein